MANNRNRFRDCTISSLPTCTIVAIRHSTKKPEIDETVGGEQRRTFEFTIFVGGPDPCLCNMDYIKASAYAFTPVEIGDVALPMPGQMLVDSTDPTITFSCKNVRLFRTKSDCRTITAVVIFDNLCAINNPFYKVDGTLITNIYDLPLAAATITRRAGHREVISQYAEWHGLFNRNGGEITDCAFVSDAQCCRPIEAMWFEKGEQFPPVNSAGMAFNPPLKEDKADNSYIITKPYYAVNGCKLNYLERKVNCEEFWLVEYIKGYLTFCTKVKEGTARIESVTVADAEFCDGTPIKMVSIEMKIRSNVMYGVAGEFTGIVPVVEFGWDDIIANRGFGALMCPGDVDQFGGEAVINNGNFNQGQGFAQAQLIVDGSGNPVEEPQWLDCNGHPQTLKAVQQGNTDACRWGLDFDKLQYMRYRNYRRVSFLDPLMLPGLLNTAIFADPPEPPEDPPEGYENACECYDFGDGYYTCSTTTTGP